MFRVSSSWYVPAATTPIQLVSESAEVVEYDTTLVISTEFHLPGTLPFARLPSSRGGGEGICLTVDRNHSIGLPAAFPSSRLI